jgi:hypothetical protein
LTATEKVLELDGDETFLCFSGYSLLSSTKRSLACM